MNKVVLMSAGVALAISLSACNYTEKTDGNASTAGAASAADVDAVEQMNAAFLAAIESKDVTAVKANYAADATMVLPARAPYKGIEAISADYDTFAADPAGKFDATNESTVVSSGGDLAYAQGTYTVTYTNPDTKAVENGNGYYIVVYKKQADGSWKIVQDISSATPAAS